MFEAGYSMSARLLNFAFKVRLCSPNGEPLTTIPPPTKN